MYARTHSKLEDGKLVFGEYTLSLRASAHAGVAIPRLEGKCIDNCPTGRENTTIFWW